MTDHDQEVKQLKKKIANETLESRKCFKKDSKINQTLNLIITCPFCQQKETVISTCLYVPIETKEDSPVTDSKGKSRKITKLLKNLNLEKIQTKQCYEIIESKKNALRGQQICPNCQEYLPILYQIIEGVDDELIASLRKQYYSNYSLIQRVNWGVIRPLTGITKGKLLPYKLPSTNIWTIGKVIQNNLYLNGYIYIRQGTLYEKERPSLMYGNNFHRLGEDDNSKRYNDLLRQNAIEGPIVYEERNLEERYDPNESPSQTGREYFYPNPIDQLTVGDIWFGDPRALLNSETDEILNLVITKYIDLFYQDPNIKGVDIRERKRNWTPNIYHFDYS